METIHVKFDIPEHFIKYVSNGSLHELRSFMLSFFNKMQNEAAILLANLHTSEAKQNWMWSGKDVADYPTQAKLLLFIAYTKAVHEVSPNIAKLLKSISSTDPETQPDKVYSDLVLSHSVITSNILHSVVNDPSIINATIEVLMDIDADKDKK